MSAQLRLLVAVAILALTAPSTSAPLPQVPSTAAPSISTVTVATQAAVTLGSAPEAGITAAPNAKVQYVTVTQPGPVNVVFNTVVVTQTVTVGPTPTRPPGSGPTWSLKPDFGSTDLSADLGVSSWSWGRTNVAVLPGIPSSAWAKPAATPAPASAPPRDTYNSTVMQVLYPAGSVNPGSHTTPIGGTGMYLKPSQSLLLPLLTPFRTGL